MYRFEIKQEIAQAFVTNVCRFQIRIDGNMCQKQSPAATKPAARAVRPNTDLPTHVFNFAGLLTYEWPDDGSPTATSPPLPRGGRSPSETHRRAAPSARQVWIQSDAPAKKTCLTMLSLAGLLTGRHQLIQRETTAQHVSCTRNACGKQRGFNPLTKKKTILAKPFREPLHNSRHSTPELDADNPKGQQWKNVTKH